MNPPGSRPRKRAVWGRKRRAECEGRSGAQQLAVAPLRQGAEVRVDAGAARRAAESTAADLFAGYHVEGHVISVAVVPPGTVEVEVRISDPAGDVTGVAAASAEAGA